MLWRFLWGGRSVFALTTLATGLGVGLGIVVGLVAAYARGRVDDLLMRTMDVILCFPQIVLDARRGRDGRAEPAAARDHDRADDACRAPRASCAARRSRSSSATSCARRRRSASRASRILFGEILPNILSPLLVEASLRYTYTIGLIAGLSFLGFGLQPPAADWGLMINENQLGIEQAPWGVVLPVLAIAILTIGDRT